MGVAQIGQHSKRALDARIEHTHTEKPQRQLRGDAQNRLAYQVDGLRLVTVDRPAAVFQERRERRAERCVAEPYISGRT